MLLLLRLFARCEPEFIGGRLAWRAFSGCLETMRAFESAWHWLDARLVFHAWLLGFQVKL